MRLFVGVYPDARFRQALTLALDPWRDRLPVRWGRPEQWHVTLQFLGQWPAERVPGLRAALDPVAERADFDVSPRGLGAFPNLERPRVLFVHLDGGENLVRLAGAVRTRVGACWPDGPQDDRPTRAHLTVARVRGHLSAVESKMLQKINLDGLRDFNVDRYTLVASTLQEGGARHRVVAEWRLRKKGE